MEVVKTAEGVSARAEGKVEQDESFSGNARESEESGVYSQGDSTGNNDSRDSGNWECFKDEVFDISIFSLPDYIQSSNLKGTRPCIDYSSILESIHGGQG